jgi:agarase
MRTGVRISFALHALALVVLTTVPALAPSAAAAPGVDAFGGWTGVATTATGRFRTEQIDGVWWLITPDGHGLFSAGIVGVRVEGDYAPSLGTAPYQDNVLARYGSEAAWADVTLARLRDLNVTTIGAWSRDDLFVAVLPYTPILGFAQHAPAVPGVALGLTGQPVRDYFDDAFATGAAVEASAAASCAADPWCIGVFSDNELGWGPGVALSLPLFDAYFHLPAGAPGKLALQSYLEAHYAGDVAGFNADFGLALSSFADVQAMTALAADWTTDSAARQAVRRAFTGIVATRYFQVVHDALRAIDPALLILGARFLSYSTPPEVAVAAAPWVDVVSMNYYELAPAWFSLAQSIAANAGFIPAPRMFDDVDTVYALTGKPILISEFGYRSAESELPNTFPPFYPTLATQAERADAFASYTRRAVARPYVVGTHWFKHADEPIQGRADGENDNWGIVDLHDDPYIALSDRMRLLNADTPTRRTLVPGGSDAGNECLLEWSLTAAPAARLVAGVTIPGGRVVCRDGDPTCDLDGVSGRCVFELSPCAPTADGRFPACAPAPLTSVALLKPTAPRDAAVAGALASSLASLVGLPVPGSASSSCGPATQIVLELGGRRRVARTVAARAFAGTRRDADRLQLVCERAS